MDTKSVFSADDRVAWHHTFAAQHAEGSIIRASAVPQLQADHPDEGSAGTGQFGTVIGPANEAGTWWEVKLDGSKDSRILTSDELVKIADDEPAAIEADEDA